MAQFTVEAILKAVGADEFARAFRNANKEMERTSGAASKASGGIGSFVGGMGKLAGAIGITKLVASGFNAIKNSVGDAVDRVDTLNRFPKMMEAMGFSSQEAENAVSKLKDGIQGLPTTLDSVVATAQGIAILTGDLDGATETTLALNNAFLASGSSSADAERGLTQYVQMLSKGEVDMQSWRTLQETMGVALNDVAKAFGFAGESAQNDLYAALQDGSITFDEFNDKIIELDQGVGGFAERALIGSEGIRTSMQNIKTAIVTGIGDAIQAVDDAMVAGGFGSISENLDKVKVKVQEVFTGIVESIGPLVEDLIAFYNELVNTTAFQSFTELMGIVIEKFNELKTSFMESQFVADLKEKFLELVETVADLDFMKMAEDTQALIDKYAPLIAGVTGATAAYGIYTVALGIKSAAETVAIATMYAMDLAAKILGGTIAFLTSPIGLAVIAIGVIIGVGVLLYQNWDKIKEKATELGERIRDKFNEIKQNISNAVESAKTAATEKFESMKSQVTEKVSNMKQAVFDKFNGIKDDAVTSFNNLKDKAAEIFDNIKTAIVTAVESIDLLAAGRAIIDGFVNGLKGAWEAGKNFISGIGQWIKDHKGPISYDRKLLVGAGEAIIGGLNRGLQESFPDVQRTVLGMAGAIENAMTASPTMDISGSIARSNSQVNAAISHELSNNGKTPMQVNLNMGGRVYSAFVDDVSTKQNTTAQLELAYL